MNNLGKAIAAAAVVVVALGGYNLLTGLGFGGPQPTPTAGPSLSPSATPQTTLPPGTYESTPFRRGGLGACPPTIPSDCVEDPTDDTITFRFAAPEGWEPAPFTGTNVDGDTPPGGAAVLFYRGSWLYSDPCRPDDVLKPDLEVGPNVDDFVSALVEHPLLDVTAPVDVTLAGYSGKYLELQVPADISTCVRYRPIEQHIYAQGPGQRWRMWVLDFDGVRVLIETNDYAGTSAQRELEIQQILDSIVITP